MLYLFGRLALSDSLDYYENTHDDDFYPLASGERTGRPESQAQATAPEQRRLAGRPCPPANPASAGGLSK